MGKQSVTNSNQLASLVLEAVERQLEITEYRGWYRSPLVGFAAADDQLFKKLRIVANPEHLLPEQMLSGAKTVISFFLPFDPALVKLNRRHSFVAREWAEAYVVSNNLIKSICGAIDSQLSGLGFQTAWEMPTHNFDKEHFLSLWSHKHVAYVCGLGSFGHHTMLITDQGCAGRFGSLVTNVEIKPTPGQKELFFSGCKKCNYCVRVCPISALQEMEPKIAKAACYTQLMEVNDYYQDLPLCDACGKCACGPCSLILPKF